MRLIIRILVSVIYALQRIWRRARIYLLKPQFNAHGKNISFDPDGVYSFENIILGSDVSLGLYPMLMASNSMIRIGNHVMFGPYVTIIGGNHNTAEIGCFMTAVTEKRPEDDLGVVIEDDVWVGARAIILNGVVVGRGSIVGAGSVVTKSVPAYSVVAGCPARVLKFRWDIDSIIQHDKILYDPEYRIPESKLRAAYEAFVQSQPG
jgi:maltose O-acetyltransferase